MTWDCTTFTDQVLAVGGVLILTIALAVLLLLMATMLRSTWRDR